MKLSHATLIALIGSGVAPGIATAQTYREDTVSLGSVYQARRYGNGVYDAAVNKTFITYNSTNMDIYVRAYNHATKAWEAAVKVASLNQSDANAYHDYGVIQILPNGKVAIFYASHTVAAYMLTPPDAHSVTGSWTKKTISTDRNAYPMPIVVGNTVYFFYARNSDLSWPYRPFRMIKSTDNGATWSTPDPIVDSKMTADKFSEVYNYGVAHYQGKIYFTYSMCGGPGGHNAQCRNLYMNYIDTATDQVFSVDGRPLGSQVDEEDLAKSVVVTASSDSPDAPNAASNIWQPLVEIDGSGRPAIGFGYYVGTTRSVRFGQFNGDRWNFQDIATGSSRFDDIAPTSDGGFDLLHSADGKIISVHRTPGGTISTNYSLTPDNAGTTANTWRASFVRGRKSIDAIGTAYGPNSKDDYSGKWPVFAIVKQ